MSLPDTLAVKLTYEAERILKKQHHPWIFSESIVKLNKKGAAGDIVIIFDSRHNKVIGVGLFDPDAPVRIKMLHFGSSAKIDEAFFNQKIEAAYDKRKELITSGTNSYRLIFGENDGFPGLIADVYAQVLVLKLYSAIWLPYLGLITDALLHTSGCGTAVLRLSRHMQSEAGQKIADGEIISGTLDQEEVIFLENNLRFTANVLKGHKTGFFLDHRENRKKVGTYAKGKKVLDVFSYTGGFSVHALAGGASEVTSVDVSSHALEAAIRNGKLNDFEGIHHTIQGDAFELLESLVRKGALFDLVIIDPPSFAKSRKEMPAAARKYGQLAALGANLVSSGGMLLLASCSSRMDTEEFFRLNEEILIREERPFTLMEKTYHDLDHPVSFKEGAYLKCGYYRLY